MVVIESARRNTPATRIFAFGLFALLLALLSLWSLTIGTTAIPLGDALRAIISEGTSHQDVVISTIITAIIVGSTLGVAGALMQAVTNNPLASPDLLGISAGAAFAVVISIVFFDAQSPLVFLWFAFGGAAVAGILVYMVASTGVSGVTPVKLALSGAVLSVFLGSVSASLLIFDMKAIDIIRLWSVGSLTGKDMAAVAAVAPFCPGRSCCHSAAGKRGEHTQSRGGCRAGRRSECPFMETRFGSPHGPDGGKFGCAGRSYRVCRTCGATHRALEPRH